MDDTPLKIAMRPTHPGRFVRDEVIEPLQLTIVAAAGVLGVRRATLSDLLNGKSAVSPEMALRIERAFGVNMETLLRMQAWHDTYLLRQRADDLGVTPYVSKPAA